MLTNKNILLISPEPWGINHVSKHHYAIELAKRKNNVYFLNPPSTKELIWQEKENLYIIDYKPKFRGLAKMPAFLSAWLIKKEVKKLEGICKVVFAVIWNFESSSFFNLKRLPSKLRISHIVDLNQNKNLKLINSTADFCLSTTNYILKRQKAFNGNSFNLGHGYASIKDTEILNLPKNSGTIKVGYLGNLLIKYLDWELVFKLVTTNTNIMFYFAGSYTNSNLSKTNTKDIFLTKTMNEHNAHFLESIKPSQINSFLIQMDILLLTYKSEEYKEQLANPHKMLEYFASGKVIVASWTDEYKNKTHLLEMVEDNLMFSEKFKEVVKNISNYNDVKLQTLRKQYALKNTYSNQVDKIDLILQKK